MTAAVETEAAPPGTLTVRLVRLDPELPVPGYGQPGAPGRTCTQPRRSSCSLARGPWSPTGVAVALPHGYAGFIHPRSGLAARHGVTVVNAPGTIDAGYRGEIKVCLLNTDREKSIRLGRGDRIAQLVIQRVETAVFEVVDELPASDRGTGGFGSTGGFTGS